MKCPMCKGKGTVCVIWYTGRGIENNETQCSTCHGTGRVEEGEDGKE